MNPQGLRILVPLDGSSTSEAVLPALRPLIRSHQVETTLLHVAGSPDDARAATMRLEVLRQALEAEGVSVRVLVHSGNASREIVAAGDPGRFDLIAMGTHGRTCMDRIIMGSVAEEVIRTSRLPVLLVRPNCRMDPWDTMLVALDGTPGSEGILDDVVRLARAVQAKVHLIRVNPPNPEWGDYDASQDDFPKTDTVAYLNRIAGDLQERGISATVMPVQGDPGDEISRLARSLGAGVIIMATEGRPDAAPGIGNSTSAEVIAKAPCAVYVRRQSRVRGISA